MAFLFDLKALVDMMSIGTLLAYSLVAVCVLILRYQPDGNGDRNTGRDAQGEESELTESESHLHMLSPASVSPTERSRAIVNTAVCVIGALAPGQPQTRRKVSFMVPLLPFLPILSIFVNIYLMVQLSGDTWVRFSVWMGVGFVIYFGYGVWHSAERRHSAERQHSGSLTQEPPDVKEQSVLKADASGAQKSSARAPCFQDVPCCTQQSQEGRSLQVFNTSAHVIHSESNEPIMQMNWTDSYQFPCAAVSSAGCATEGICDMC
ncbi:Low affinity cationic amino acid transporter 2-like [Arapaima gigas]